MRYCFLIFEEVELVDQCKIIIYINLLKTKKTKIERGENNNERFLSIFCLKNKPSKCHIAVYTIKII